MNPNITPTNPALMPAISLPPFELFFFPVAEGEAEEPVAVGLPPVAVGFVTNACPMLGSGTSPSTNHPPTVELGQAGGVLLGL